ncbi:MAG: efflux RND transporter periplasmic adaptor subunit [Armatimonadetes bacterium]|nr:efflux RND transporter periplasmic adaptor subunit [Armatimonadota bacterium]
MKIVRGSVLALLLAAGVLALMRQSSARKSVPEPATAESPAPVVASAAARLEMLYRQAEAPGTVRPLMQAELSTKIMGRVERVAAREGDRVRAGQALVTLDARDLDAQIRQASAELNTARAAYRSARVAVSLESEQSRARIGQAEAAVAGAKSKLDWVKSGPRPQERAQAKSAVVAAEAGVKLAEADLKRMQMLFAEGAVAKQRLDMAQTQYDTARAQLDIARESESLAREGSRSEEIRSAQEGLRQAQAALAQARSAASQVRIRRQEADMARSRIGQGEAGVAMVSATRSYAAVRAPFSGVVVSRKVDPGDMAAPGAPLLTIESDAALRLESVVPESLMRSIRLGASVPVRIDSLGESRLEGKVAEIVPSADTASRTFIVKVTLPGMTGLRSGLFGRAYYSTGYRKAITVPLQAVRRSYDLPFVFVLDGSGTARMRLVTLGKAHPGRIEVLSGLTPGERVVTSGVEKLEDGMRVASR